MTTMRAARAEAVPSGAAAAPPARRGGRPSKDNAEQLAGKIIAVATGLFLEDGYGATSIEAIARTAQISKRTFYHRFADKAAVFAAVVHRIVETLRPPREFPLYEGDQLDQILGRLAKLIVHAAVNPRALALHRMIVAEAVRFPELAAVVDAEGTRTEAIMGIAALLERETAGGRLAVMDSAYAAEQFIQLVIAVPQRRALGLGTPMTTEQLDQWAIDAVRLFIDGCRPQPTADRLLSVRM